MLNYSLPKYDMYRNRIKQARERGDEWETISLENDKEKLEKFIEQQRELNFWDITSEQWVDLVNLQKDAERNTIEIKYRTEQAMLMDEGQDSDVTIPQDERSSWQLYKKHLLDQGFKPKVVQNIEDTTLKLLRRLNNNTVDMEPIKGLVIGNVQSGKTANMAALMAMAADWGWNMFIVLSGTIENLRQQTQKRLFNDLNKPGNINWRGLEHLSKKSTYGQRAQDLRFEEDSADRHFTVCLKNSGRLRKLIEWLQADPNKQKQMKIIVIDDEADQAGINTADITKNERKTINKLIVNLVEGRDKQGKEITTKYRAMNYIGYTATPYANILNEVAPESLYPRNFISTLSVSDEYFGPQQIFGVDGMEYDGMNIIRLIEKEELDIVKEIHDGSYMMPTESLKDAMCWFICGAATMRYWGYNKPISMLIHTSQKQDHHEYVSGVINDWFATSSKDRILERCSKIWEDETNELTLEDFKEQYKDYGRMDQVREYPSFNEIEEEIKKLIYYPLSNIRLDEEQEFEYQEGIHLCIDNCKNSGVTEDGMYVRLAYPDSNNMPAVAPVFIVVGGATLSRGLTIEGLISTFFLRSVGQADTLMQMGRWFGYRRGYELLPRLWITERTRDQFRFLSTLDKELREEILHMDTLGTSPMSYGPKVKNSPKCSFIRITAKNKMQSAEETDMDYSGTSNQTTIFENSKEILMNNKLITEEFINSLGVSEKNSNKHAQGALIWRNISFDTIYSGLLKNFQFSRRNKVFNDIESVKEWIGKVTEEGNLANWNVIVSGKGKANQEDNNWKFINGSVDKVTRTRRKQNDNEMTIDIGVLREPKDLIADVDIESLDQDTKYLVEHYTPTAAKDIRSKAGLDLTPQLIIYLIDKGSKATTTNRKDLEAEEDIVGICINVPGGRRGSSLAKAVSIKFEDTLFNNEGDVEE